MRIARVLVASVWLVGLLVGIAAADAVDLSLNLQYHDPADHSLGGMWTLAARTENANGIAAINAIMANVNAAGITYQGGIGATTLGGEPFVLDSGTFVELLYFLDVTTPESVVFDVGRGAGTPGNMPLDPLGDPAWDNTAAIARGAFGAMTPAFTVTDDLPPNETGADVLPSREPPLFRSPAVPVTTVVRESEFPIGDYNHNGEVEAGDYPVWRNSLETVAPGLAADGNGNGMIDEGDFGVWKEHYGIGVPLGAGGGAGGQAVAIPEPGAAVIGGVAALIVAAVRRRR